MNKNHSQKNSFPHIVDKVVNKFLLILYIVNKSFFVTNVFYLNMKNLLIMKSIKLDYNYPLNYNVLVYALGI